MTTLKSLARLQVGGEKTVSSISTCVLCRRIWFSWTFALPCWRDTAEPSQRRVYVLKLSTFFCVSLTGNRAWKVSCTQGILLVSLCRKFKPGWCEHNTSTNTSTKRFYLHRTGSHLRVLFVLVNQPYVLFLFQKHWGRWQYSNSSRSKHCLIFVKNAQEELVIIIFFCQCQATGVISWQCCSI